MIFLEQITIDLKELRDHLGHNHRLRWFAIIGIFGTTFFADYVFSIGLKWLPILICCGALILFNLITWKTCCKTDRESIKYYLLHGTLQNAIDAIVLTVLLYFTGSFTNPFQFFYLFHIIGAGILLGKNVSYYQAIFNIALFVTMSTLVFYEVLPYYPLKGLSSPLNEISFNLFFAWMVAFSVTMLISAYLVEFVMNMIRVKQREIVKRNEQLLLEQQRRRKIMEMVVHELKSPLTSSQTMLRVMTDGYMGDIPEQVNTKLLKITEKLRDLQDMVKNILSLKKMEFDRSTKKPVSWKKIIHKVADGFVEQSQIKKLDYKVELVEDDLMTLGDPDELMKVAENLISNAIRYTPENGTVSVSLTFKGMWSFFVVEDNGIGIPKEDQKKIFTDFYRAKNAVDFTQTGTGLGMAITKSIVEKNNGEISFESEVGKGTTFTVKLPLFI